MAFELSTDVPAGYWHHNSGGEHTGKHVGDQTEINQLRIEMGRTPYDAGELQDRMHAGGVVTVRPGDALSGAGDIAGYLVAEHRMSGNQLDTVEVEDMLVLPEQRGQGIGGFLLGKLITVRYHDMRAKGISVVDYGKQLIANGRGYVLPGIAITAYEVGIGSEQVPKFKNSLPKGWSGLRSIEFESGESLHEVFVDGDVVSTIDCLPDRQYRVPGSDKVRSALVFAAIDLLNSQIN